LISGDQDRDDAVPKVGLMAVVLVDLPEDDKIGVGYAATLIAEAPV
jgi:hypothetical protein